MAIDTPATIAILGAGPVGLEAALYARFLGYDVQVYERGDVAEHVLLWGHVRMFTPFGMNRSPLGLAALRAQDNAYQRPDDRALLTGRQWAEQYLMPLARTDLLVDAIRPGHEVIAVRRDEVKPSGTTAPADLAGGAFRIVVRGPNHEEQIAVADAVIDASGVYGTPNPLGSDGRTVEGESDLRDRIQYTLPDVLGRDRLDYAGRHALLVGGGCSAATTVVSLAQLCAEVPGTRVDWVTRDRVCSDREGPVSRIENDPLVERDRLAQWANHCARSGHSQVTLLPETHVRSIQWNAAEAKFTVQLEGPIAQRRAYDRVICHTGFRPDVSLHGELRMPRPPLARQTDPTARARQTPNAGPGPGRTLGHPDDAGPPVPDWYILGSKSHDGNRGFLLADGLNQIRQLFTILGGRHNLDLYANLGPLVG